jgi:integrase
LFWFAVRLPRSGVVAPADGEIHGFRGRERSDANARTREYLTGKEVEKLMEAARYEYRDATMMIAYRHGLRASEVCDLQWHQVEINSGRLHVRRTKRGTPSVHPIQGDPQPRRRSEPISEQSHQRFRVALRGASPPLAN